MTTFLQLRKRFLARLLISRISSFPGAPLPWKQIEKGSFEDRMRIRPVFLATFVLAFLTPCFAHHTAVVVNKDNVVENLTSANLAKIVRGEVKKWPDGRNIVLVLHRDSAGEDETLEHLNKMSATDWKAFLVAHKGSITFVDTDADVLKTVQAEPGAIGLVEVHSIDSSVNVVHVDGKLPSEFGYLPH
jgi:hypothetical protein